MVLKGGILGVDKADPSNFKAETLIFLNKNSRGKGELLLYELLFRALKTIKGISIAAGPPPG